MEPRTFYSIFLQTDQRIKALLHFASFCPLVSDTLLSSGFDRPDVAFDRKAPLALPSHGSVASTLDFLARAQQRLVDGQNRQSLATQDRWPIFSLGMSNIRSFRICARSSMCFIHISRFMFMFANKCYIIFSILSCSILFFPDSAPCSSGAPTSWKSHQSVFAFNHFRSVLVWTCSRSLPKGQASPASPSHLPDFGSPAESLANSLSVSCR